MTACCVSAAEICRGFYAKSIFYQFELFFGGDNVLLIGTDNVGLGDGAASGLTAGISNTGVGSEALRDVSNGAYNTALGTAALRVLVSRHDNVAIGASAERANTTGIGNIVVGASAGLARTSGDYNICISTGAISSVTNGGVNNVAIGRSAMLAYSTYRQHYWRHDLTLRCPSDDGKATLPFRGFGPTSSIPSGFLISAEQKCRNHISAAERSLRMLQFHCITKASRLRQRTTQRFRIVGLERCGDYRTLDWPRESD